ncbi:Uncharacterised protein [Vibrio cholerae]|nr:Uncharacterised protein [Vibrio cholerae]
MLVQDSKIIQRSVCGGGDISSAVIPEILFETITLAGRRNKLP